MSVPQYITIDLGSFRRSGSASLISRMFLGDKRKVDLAARMLNMCQADFTRLVLVQAAEQVLMDQEERVLPKPQLDPAEAPGKRIKSVGEL